MFTSSGDSWCTMSSITSKSAPPRALLTAAMLRKCSATVRRASFVVIKQLPGKTRHDGRLERQAQLLKDVLDMRHLDLPGFHLIVEVPLSGFTIKWPRESTLTSSVQEKPHGAYPRLTGRMKLRPRSKNPLPRPL
uniref:Uncharacterized protein n=1 Tax=Peronospora matthiolae TaxID=2874970 RepID=A0AAV1U3I6_9STRA